MLAIFLTFACSRYIFNGVVLHAHPIRGESPNQRNATGEVATTSPPFYNEPHRSHVAACAQSFAPWQQATIEFTRCDHSIIACSRHIYILLFVAHIPFMVNHAFNVIPPERLQQYPVWDYLQYCNVNVHCSVGLSGSLDLLQYKNHKRVPCKRRSSENTGA